MKNQEVTLYISTYLFIHEGVGEIIFYFPYEKYENKTCWLLDKVQDFCKDTQKIQNHQ